MLIFDCRQVSCEKIVWGVSLEPARAGLLPPRLGGLVSGFAFLRAFVSRSSRRLFSFHFTGKQCFHSGSVDFRLLARFL